jgi:hypothetical protein
MACKAYLEGGVGPRLDALVSPQSPARSPREGLPPHRRARHEHNPALG